MKKIILISLILISISLAAVFILNTNNKPQDVFIKEPYAFATSDNAKTAAAFMVINNSSLDDDKLISATSDISQYTEVHENYIDPDDGTMMMRKIRFLEVPKNKEVILEPKGYHIMFINLKSPLKIGETFPITLNFEKSGAKNIIVNITAPGKNPHSHH